MTALCITTDGKTWGTIGLLPVNHITPYNFTGSAFSFFGAAKSRLRDCIKS